MCKQVITFDTSVLLLGGLKIILVLFFCTIAEETVSKFCWGLGMLGCVWQFGRGTDLFWGHLSGTGRGDKLKIIVFSSP